MRFPAAVLALLLAPFATTAFGQGRSEVRVAAHVLAVAKMRHVEAVAAVQVTEGARGEVAVPQAATFEVFVNTGGFAVDFRVVDPAVQEVTVDGLDAPLTVGVHGGSAPVRMAAGARIARRTLHYRVRYAPGTEPGARPSPLALAIRPNL